jgi:PAS domain S-box-containing protein
MTDVLDVDIRSVMDSMSDGVYVCDLDRRIVYWSKSAQRITGWRSEDVVGRQCFDNVLCHVDKDGHRLCGEEFCPLHRAMITGVQSKRSLLVYARGADEQRVPMHVSVAPIRDGSGTIVGGVETFRDASAAVHDLERARAIQQLALRHHLPEDDRLRVTMHYIPNEIIGGDFYAIERLNDDHYGLMLADVMGHGLAAALYTIHLSSLWDRHHHLLARPAAFATEVNRELARILRGEVSFATAVCGLIDLKDGSFRFTGAGGPPVLLIRPDGQYRRLENPGLPLAVLEDAAYEETAVEIEAGDSLLFFSDGAFEVADAAGNMIGIDGFIEILQKQGYPESDLRMDLLEEELLKYSNAIRLEDDLTFVEVRFRQL